MPWTEILVAFVTFCAIYYILAISLNLEYGFTGIPNFGKVLFYAAGAYTSAVVTGHLLTRLAGGSGADVCTARSAALRETFAAQEPLAIMGVFLLALVASALVGALLGGLLSLPSLRVRDVYLGLLLLVAAEIGRVFVRSTPGIICGSHGMGGIPNPFSWVSPAGTRYLVYALLCVLVALLCYWLVQRVVHTPWGRVLKMVRDDEEAAQALGKNPAKVKIQVMMLGSSLAAVAGSLYAFYSQFVGTEDFVPFLTFLVLSMVILGGQANNLGAIFGVLVMTAIDRFTRGSIFSMLGIDLPFDVSYARYVVTGLVLALLVMYRPQGLFPERPLRTPAWEVWRRRAKSRA